MYMIHPVDQGRLPAGTDSLLEKLEQSSACGPCPSWAFSEPTLLLKDYKRSICLYMSSPLPPLAALNSEYYCKSFRALLLRSRAFLLSCGLEGWLLNSFLGLAGLPPGTWNFKTFLLLAKQLEPDLEQQTGSKLGNEYVKAVYCQPAYLIYRQSISCEMPGWSTSWNQHCWEKYQ